MEVKGCIRHKFCKNLPKCCFLFLVVFVFIAILGYLDLLKLKYEEISTINLQGATTDPQKHHGFCTFQPLSSTDALEERLILDSIAWPETPLLPAPLPLKQTSDPAHSTFTILPGKREGGQWHVGDQLEVMIKIYDFQGQAKKSGGDVLIARLHNKTLGAGVAGKVVDHLNGSYSAVFSLLWEGSAQVEVTLVHPSEAVTVLRRLNKEEPDRVSFKSLFRSGSISQTTICNVCLRETGQPLCNFTDLRTGEPWFCYKPEELSCDDRINHVKGDTKELQTLKATEDKLFQRGVNMKVFIKASGPANVAVLPQRKGQPEDKESIGKSGVSGYYYQGVWRALGGIKVRQFNTTSAVNQCLKGKIVHLYGDSTIRQWFEYLDAFLPDAKEFNLYSMRQAGPFMLLDKANKFLATYRCHGLPLRSYTMSSSALHYIANEIDGLTGGDNTVIVFGVWAHFGTFPVELYIRRLQSIRRAVVHLLNRSPGTLVVIRTPNPKTLTLSSALINSDWYSLQEDKVLRAMFKGLNVHLVDAWEMTLAHHLPHLLHPQPPIIKNMIDVLLTYVCPQKGS
uniref:NXPE family member 3-like n=1 Tax=Semicossyphus pulcher TaxID=241346 RepID=UPI0037E842B3